MSFSEWLGSHDPIRANLLINLPLNSLINLSATDVNIKFLCQDDYIWQQRVINEFFDESQNFCHATWKDYYMYLYQTVPVKKYQDNVFLKKYRISRKELCSPIIRIIGNVLTLYTDINGNVIAYSNILGHSYQLFRPMPIIERIYTFKTIRNEVFHALNKNINHLRAIHQYDNDDDYMKLMSEKLSQELTAAIPLL
jgi:hypothetical protein